MDAVDGVRFDHCFSSNENAENGRPVDNPFLIKLSSCSDVLQQARASRDVLRFATTHFLCRPIKDFAILESVLDDRRSAIVRQWGIAHILLYQRIVFQ